MSPDSRTASRQIQIRRPDDWHIHLREGDMLPLTVDHASRQFRRVMVMPNLKPPVDTLAAAQSYRERILSVVPTGRTFEPLMTLYLTDRVTPAVVREASALAFLKGIKLYPAGATTNAEAGVASLEAFYPTFEAMEKADLPLLVHGEEPAVDIFDRERLFIERHLASLRVRFPHLRIVLEHVSSKEGVQFVREHGPRTAGTITLHHMCLTRNDLFHGKDGAGLHPHHFCLPVVKTEADRQAVSGAAFSGESCFFLGTDSAPHPRNRKESACGSAGIYTAHAALELCAELFDRAESLSQLEAFACLNGAAFYGLPPNDERIILETTSWSIPETYAAGTDTQLVPFRAGETVAWTLQGSLARAGGPGDSLA